MNGFENQKSEAVKNNDLEQAVLQQMNRIAKESKLDEIERIKKCIIAKEQFTVFNGLLTNTQKLIRMAFKKKFSV